MILEKYIKNSTNSINFGTLVVKPNDFVAGQTYPVMIFMHGIGERGNGSSIDLDKLVNGGVPKNLQRATDKYKFIVVAPQTPYAWNMGEVDFAYGLLNTSTLDFKTDLDRVYLSGLSLGGGGTFYNASQRPGDSARFAAIIPIATTWITGTWDYIAKNRTPVWAFHNLNDTNSGTPVAATNLTVDSINKTATDIKAVKTIFNASGHGGWDVVYNPDSPPAAPGGQGFTTASKPLYDWMLSVTRKNPSQPNENSIPPSVNVTAVAGVLENGVIKVSDSYTTKSAIVALNATLSQNAKGYKWAVTEVPDGVSIWHPIITSGAGWFTAQTNFPKEGNYKIVLTTNEKTDFTGKSATDSITLTYSKDGTVPPEKQLLQKVFIPKNNNYVYVYDDGSTETKLD